MRNRLTSAWMVVGGLAFSAVIGGGLVRALSLAGIYDCASQVCPYNSWWGALALGCWC